MAAIAANNRQDAVKIDKRTREARLMKQVRAEMIAHVGGKPSATERVIIERITWLTLRLSQLDRKIAAGGEMSEHDSKAYLAWSNSLTRAVRDLGLKGKSERPKTLAELLSSAAA